MDINSPIETLFTLKEVIKLNVPLWLYKIIHYIFNYKSLIYCLFPVILLEKLFPLNTRSIFKTNSFLFDYIYPLFTYILSWPIISRIISLSNQLSRNIFPESFINIFSSQNYIIQFIVIFLIEDFIRWYSHYLRHKIPILWNFHSIHHSHTIHSIH